MNVNSIYIPKSNRGREICKVLGVPPSEGLGRYVCSVAQVTDHTIARQVAYAADPEDACHIEDDAILRARRLLDAGHVSEATLIRAASGWPFLGWDPDHDIK